MPVTAPTMALKGELEVPSRIDAATWSGASSSYRPRVAQMSQQVGRIQEFLVAVEEAETNEEIVGKLESLRQTLRAIDRQTTEAEKIQTRLSMSVRKLFEEELPDLRAAIERNE